MIVLGRDDDVESGPSGRLGRYRASDGSDGAPVGVDLDRPHAAAVVGKRGSGKSYTLGVLAEELAATDGVRPVVVDPMGAFRTLDRSPVDARVARPRVTADALPARAWCGLLGLDPESGAGSLVWRAASETDRLASMRAFVEDVDAPAATRRAAANHLRLAAGWDVFGADAVGRDEEGDRPLVLDCSGVPAEPASAVVAAVASSLYRARVGDDCESHPWLLVDEAHAVAEGVAERAIERLLTRGRAPGVSVVLATQRPSALPSVAISQSDLLVAHRLTDERDREALAAARPSYVGGSVTGRLPTATGTALVVDDATEAAHTVRIRERETPHGGATPRVSEE